MLHQAALLYNQEILTKLDNDLSIWKSTHLRGATEWRIEGLVDKFANYKHIIVSSGLVGTTPSIDQLNNKNDRNQYNQGKKKFENASDPI